MTQPSGSDPGPTPRRRFTLLDGMILVAATAGGCAYDSMYESFTQDHGKTEILADLASLFKAGAYADLVVVLMMLAFPVVAMWTLAMIPLRLLKPRPKIRRLASQPGWVACCGFAVTLGFVVPVGLVAVLDLADASWMMELLTMWPAVFAPAILSAWLALILGCRWRAEPSWVDRFGRVLGVFWIAMTFVWPVMLRLMSP